MHGILTFEHPERHRQALLEFCDDETHALSRGPGDNRPRGEGWGEDSFDYAILEDGVVVGLIQFQKLTSLTHVGFFISKENRRKGILLSAWNALHQKYGMRFRAACWSHNTPAFAVLLAMGFKFTHHDRSKHGQTSNFELFVNS